MTMSSTAQMRKIKKPMIERRRRERINESLQQLKSIVLEFESKEQSRYSKMEKADILEMTVKHLKDMHVFLRGKAPSHPRRDRTSPCPTLLRPLVPSGNPADSPASPGDSPEGSPSSTSVSPSTPRSGRSSSETLSSFCCQSSIATPDCSTDPESDRREASEFPEGFAESQSQGYTEEFTESPSSGCTKGFPESPSKGYMGGLEGFAKSPSKGHSEGLAKSPSKGFTTGFAECASDAKQYLVNSVRLSTIHERDASLAVRSALSRHLESRLASGQSLAKHSRTDRSEEDLSPDVRASGPYTTESVNFATVEATASTAASNFTVAGSATGFDTFAHCASVVKSSITPATHVLNWLSNPRTVHCTLAVASSFVAGGDKFSAGYPSTVQAQNGLPVAYHYSPSSRTSDASSPTFNALSWDINTLTAAPSSPAVLVVTQNSPITHLQMDNSQINNMQINRSAVGRSMAPLQQRIIPLFTSQPSLSFSQISSSPKQIAAVPSPSLPDHTAWLTKAKRGNVGKSPTSRKTKSLRCPNPKTIEAITRRCPVATDRSASSNKKELAPHGNALLQQAFSGSAAQADCQAENEGHLRVKSEHGAGDSTAGVIVEGLRPAEVEVWRPWGRKS